MANTIPFTAYFKIVPNRGNGKRFEIQYSRENMAGLVHNDLLTNFINGNIAQPGGTVTSSLAEGPANVISAVAVKPQFGDSPDTLTVVGFYNQPGEDSADETGEDSADENHPPYGEITIISHGAVLTGPGTGPVGRVMGVTPSANNTNIAAALRAELLAAITSVSVELIKLEVAGQAYGWGGVHLP